MQKCTKIAFFGPGFGPGWHFLRVFRQRAVFEPGLNWCKPGSNCFLLLSARSNHACGISSGKPYSVPITVMLFTRPMSIVPLQDEVSVVIPSS